MFEHTTYAAAIRAAAERAGATLSAGKEADVLRYVEHLLLVNETLNLTRIVAPDDVAVKHFEDSWTLLPFLPAAAFSLLDIGTGAGFPGFAVKLVRPDSLLTVIESIGKKVRFLQEAAALIPLDVDIRQGRAEELAHDPYLRGAFDVVTARAVASLDLLVEMALPFVKKGGLFIAMRGQEETVPASVVKLGAEPAGVHHLLLPGDLTRTLYLFRKVSLTPERYPRSLNTMRKHPI